MLFLHLKRTENNADVLTFEDFSVTFPKADDGDFIRAAYSLFDDQDQGQITRQQLLVR